MNKERRKEIKKQIDNIKGIIVDLELIRSDEEFSFDSIPENLQGSMRAMDSEEAIDVLGDAIDTLESVVKDLSIL